MNILKLIGILIFILSVLLGVGYLTSKTKNNKNLENSSSFKNSFRNFLDWLRKKKDHEFDDIEKSSSWEVEEKEEKKSIWDWTNSGTDCGKFKRKLQELVPKVSKNIGEFPKLAEIESHSSKYGLK